MRLLFLAAAGAILGFASAKALFVGVAVTFVVWGFAALGIGTFSMKARAAAANGAFFWFPAHLRLRGVRLHGERSRGRATEPCPGWDRGRHQLPRALAGRRAWAESVR